MIVGVMLCMNQACPPLYALEIRQRAGIIGTVVAEQSRAIHRGMLLVHFGHDAGFAGSVMAIG